MGLYPILRFVMSSLIFMILKLLSGILLLVIAITRGKTGKYFLYLLLLYNFSYFSMSKGWLLICTSTKAI